VYVGKDAAAGTGKWRPVLEAWHGTVTTCVGERTELAYRWQRVFVKTVNARLVRAGDGVVFFGCFLSFSFFFGVAGCVVVSVGLGLLQLQLPTGVGGLDPAPCRDTLDVIF